MLRFINQRNKINWLLALASMLICLALSIENYFYYPSYFNLVYLSDFVADYLLSSTSMEPWELLEDVNQRVASGITVILFLATFLVPWKKRLAVKVYLSLAWLGMLLFYLAAWQDHGFQIPFLAEIALQLWILPVILFVKQSTKRFWILLMLLSALTFLGHGVYALNIYPMPGYYVDMLHAAFGISEQTSKYFLKLIGIVDVLSIILIFYKPTQRSMLLYMIFWGALTAFARPLFNFSWVFWEESIITWVPEMLKRGVHYLVPMALLFHARQLPSFGVKN